MSTVGLLIFGRNDILINLLADADCVISGLIIYLQFRLLYHRINHVGPDITQAKGLRVGGPAQ